MQGAYCACWKINF